MVHITFAWWFNLGRRKWYEQKQSTSEVCQYRFANIKNQCLWSRLWMLGPCQCLVVLGSLWFAWNIRLESMFRVFVFSHWFRYWVALPKSMKYHSSLLSQCQPTTHVVPLQKIVSSRLHACRTIKGCSHASILPSTSRPRHATIWIFGSQCMPLSGDVQLSDPKYNFIKINR